MQKIIIVIGIGIIALALGGCPRPAETPPAGEQTATLPAPTPAPESSAAGGGEAAAPAESGAEEGEWKKVWGPDEAKVKVEAFYPFNEDHQWVQDYAKEIAERYPDTVQVTVYDMYSEEGSKVWEERGLHCGAWVIDGKVAEAPNGIQLLKSETAGGWKKEELFEAVAAAVAKAEGGGSEKSAPAGKSGKATG